MRNYFRERVFNAIIPRNVRLAEAPSFGKPIHFYDPACVGARAYLNVVQELLNETIKLKQLAEERNS